MFQLLSAFQIVVGGCFGIDLSDSYEIDINNFNNEVISVIKYSKEKLKIKHNPTWKVHILVCHLTPFLDMKKVGLGIFCEQTSDAALSIIKPTMQRFHRKADHHLHGSRLLRAAGDFSSKNM